MWTSVYVSLSKMAAYLESMLRNFRYDSAGGNRGLRHRINNVLIRRQGDGGLYNLLCRLQVNILNKKFSSKLLYYVTFLHFSTGNLPEDYGQTRGGCSFPWMIAVN